jgi:uncharacterized membrane protein YkoI
MNTSKLRSKRIVIPTIAAVAVIGVGGVIWSSASADELTGTELDRASSAALDAVGEGRVTDTERGDEEGAYEVEVTKDDGTQVDVHLDEGYQVLSQDADDQNDDKDGDDSGADDSGADDNGPDDNGADDNGADDNEADDRALTDAERSSAEKAALEAVGSGRVTGAEASDDRGEAYEVEVRTADGTEWTVELDASFRVLDTRADD